MPANEPQPIKQIHVKLDPQLHQALKLEAAYCDMTIQELVVQLIRRRIQHSEFSGMIEEDNADA